MHTTPVSLLQSLQRPQDVEKTRAAWDRFFQLYTPLFLHWAQRLKLQEADARDLVQEVFVHLLRSLPRFQYDASRSFRGWLHTILLNCWRDHLTRTARRKEVAVASLEPSDADPVQSWIDGEYRDFLVARALELIKVDFQTNTWRACWEVVVLGKAPADVAAELGLTLNGVYLAKARVLARLRQELDGLWE